MRILCVTNNYTPYSGGVVSSLNALIPALQQQGHEVILVAPQLVAAHTDDPAWVRRVPSLVRFSWRTNHMAVPWRPKNFLTTIVHDFKPEVIHVQHPFLLGAVALKVARKVGLPVVFTYHTMYEAYTHYVPLPPWLVRCMILWLVKRFCNAVDTVIVPSSAVLSLVHERGITTPLVVIPSPLQNIFLQQRERSLCTDNRLVLLTVGRFVPEKNMAAVLDLYAQLPREKFRLVLVGYGVLYESLKKYAYDTLKLSTHDVCFIHKPTKEQLVQAYTDADLFLFTSQTDTQGLVLIEAMAAGLPVFALPGPGQQEVVHDGENGFICATIKELREKVSMLYDDEQQRKKLSTGARLTAHNYTPAIITQHVSSEYRRLNQ